MSFAKHAWQFIENDTRPFKVSWTTLEKAVTYKHELYGDSIKYNLCQTERFLIPFQTKYAPKIGTFKFIQACHEV